MTAEPAASGPELIAYRLRRRDMPIVPASGRRVWMDATTDHFAYRCLPLKVANEAGWMILSGHTVLATWDGGPAKENVHVEYLRGEPPFPVSGHFGHGVLTFALPYLFRTAPGYNLLLRGPANWPKDGATALEGLVETDWTAVTATMNWKLTRPGLTVRFDAGDPICMLVPARRHELEAVQPRYAELAEDPALVQRYGEWTRSRRQFLVDLPSRTGVPRTERWQKHYMQGHEPSGVAAPEHQRKLALRSFIDTEGSGTGKGRKPAPDQ